MGNRFQEELVQLKMRLLEMAALTEQALKKGNRALFERNVDLAREVIDGDQEINALEMELDRSSLRLLALEQPLARDLRFIFGCMRISIDLERIADLAANISRRAIFLTNRPPLPTIPAFEELAEAAMDMLHTAIAAFASEDVDRAREVCRMDDTADQLNVAVLKTLLDHMVKDVPAVERSVQTIIAARCLERIADQATNIAESVVFIVRGVNIKHHCESNNGDTVAHT